MRKQILFSPNIRVFILLIIIIFFVNVVFYFSIFPKLGLLPIIDNTIYIQYMTPCWREDCMAWKSELLCHSNVDDQTYKLKFIGMGEQNKSVHLQHYYDPDMRMAKWNKSPLIPRIAYNMESYSNSRCVKESSCVKNLNWIISTTPHYKAHLDKFNYNEFNYETKIWKPKMDYINQEKLAYLYKNNMDRTNQDYIPALGSWFTSYCQETDSNRIDYMKELMQYIKIDSYGKCLHNKKVPENINSLHPTDFKQTIIGKYKFYFSLENSLCKDYISEKPFESLESGTVPVLMVHPDMLSVMPKKSYIFVGDFKSAKDLAEYLKILDENKEEYKKYFEWRSDPTQLKDWLNTINTTFSKTIQDYNTCTSVNMYLQWIKDGTPPLPIAKTHSNQCLDKNYFQVL